MQSKCVAERPVQHRLEAIILERVADWSTAVLQIYYQEQAQRARAKLIAEFCTPLMQSDIVRQLVERLTHLVVQNRKQT